MGGNPSEYARVMVDSLRSSSARNSFSSASNITDCLTLPRVTAADLASGEPDYYFIGSRSYGSASSFLLRTGLAQLETILDSLRR